MGQAVHFDVGDWDHSTRMFSGRTARSTRSRAFHTLCESAALDAGLVGSGRGASSGSLPAHSLPLPRAHSGKQIQETNDFPHWFRVLDDGCVDVCPHGFDLCFFCF